MAADVIDKRRRAGDVPAHNAECLGQGALDHGRPVLDAVAFGDAAAALPINPDSMDLIEIGHRAIAIGYVTKFLDRGDIPVHRVDRLEAHELRSVRWETG